MSGILVNDYCVDLVYIYVATLKRDKYKSIDGKNILIMFNV